jgi:uncharacterized glyoxalase superfamily protein PhnB
MRANRSMPRSPVIPELVYPDVREAVAWLCDAFGFAVRWIAGGHRAQLAVGDGAVVVMADDGGGRATPQSPIVTHGVLVRVEDVDAHHARAHLHGARILDPPTDFPYGERQYNAEDLAGHRWTFSQTIADVAPEDWGGESARSPG